MLALHITEKAQRQDNGSKVEDVTACIIGTSFTLGRNKLPKRVVNFCFLYTDQAQLMPVNAAAANHVPAPPESNHDVPTSNPLASAENKPLSSHGPHSHKAG